jgi:hypothetical protein
VGIAQTKYAVLEILEVQVAAIVQLVPKASPVAWKLTFASSRYTKSDERLAGQSRDIKRVQCAAANGAAGIAACPALTCNGFGTFLAVASIGCVENGNCL